VQLDFSEFHPLDHTLLECCGYPGGWRRHLEYRWDFQWRDRVRKHTSCRLGRHHDVVVRRCGPGGIRELAEVVAVRCLSCGRPANEAEWKAALVDERERGLL